MPQCIFLIDFLHFSTELNAKCCGNFVYGFFFLIVWAVLSFTLHNFLGWGHVMQPVPIGIWLASTKWQMNLHHCTVEVFDVNNKNTGSIFSCLLKIDKPIYFYYSSWLCIFILLVAVLLLFFFAAAALCYNPFLGHGPSVEIHWIIIIIFFMYWLLLKCKFM